MTLDRIALATLLAFGGGLVHAECDFKVEVNDEMRFKISQMVADASCDNIKVTINHTGKLAANVMGHNWVLAKSADVQAIATEGMMVGLDNNYLTPGDARVLAATDIVGAGESASTSFSPKVIETGESYTFFCSFPGHWASMKGDFILK